MIVIDTFLIAGQSLAMGCGDSTLSPVPPTGNALQFYGGSLSDAVDPVGAAQSGSSWPAFGNAYFNLAGRVPCVVPCAVSGSSVAAAADAGTGNWDAPGTSTGSTLYAASITALDAAVAALTTAGYSPTRKGMIWRPGETDAAAINSGTITAATFKAAALAMIARYRAYYGSAFPVYIIKLRIPPSSITTTGFIAVRNALEEIALSDPFTHIASRAPETFGPRGLVKSDQLHEYQDGQNEVGVTTAHAIALQQFPGAPMTVYSGGFDSGLTIAAVGDANAGCGLMLDASAATGGKKWLLYSTANGASDGVGHLVVRDHTAGNEPKIY